MKPSSQYLHKKVNNFQKNYFSSTTNFYDIILYNTSMFQKRFSMKSVVCQSKHDYIFLLKTTTIKYRFRNDCIAIYMYMRSGILKTDEKL